MMSFLDCLHHREIEIPNDPGLRRFVVQEYANNGRPILSTEIQIVEDNGATWWEPDWTITVNLPERDLPEGWFFVRAHGYEKELGNLLATGLFQDAGNWIPAGHVGKYARVWRLKPADSTKEGN